MPTKTVEQKGKVVPHLPHDPEKRLQRNKKSILKILKQKPEIVSVQGNYSGSGDDGQITDINFYGEGWKEIPVDNLKVSYIRASSFFDDKKKRWVERPYKEEMGLASAVEEFMYDYISQNYSGYENNDGGGGSCEFDPHSGEVKWNHYWMVSENDGERLI